MSNAKICDRCRRIVTRNTTGIYGLALTRPCYIGERTENYDLCRDCYEKFCAILANNDDEEKINEPNKSI